MARVDDRTRVATWRQSSPDLDRFGAMPADLVGEVLDELKEQLPHGYAPWQPALVNTEPPEHNRIRKLSAKAVDPRGGQEA